MKNLKELRIYYELYDINYTNEPIGNAREDGSIQLDSLLRLHLYFRRLHYRDSGDWDSAVLRTPFQFAFPNLQEFSINKIMSY